MLCITCNNLHLRVLRQLFYPEKLTENLTSHTLSNPHLHHDSIRSGAALAPAACEYTFLMAAISSRIFLQPLASVFPAAAPRPVLSLGAQWASRSPRCPGNGHSAPTLSPPRGPGAAPAQMCRRRSRYGGFPGDSSRETSGWGVSGARPLASRVAAWLCRSRVVPAGRSGSACLCWPLLRHTGWIPCRSPPARPLPSQEPSAPSLMALQRESGRRALFSVAVVRL